MLQGVVGTSIRVPTQESGKCDPVPITLPSPPPWVKKEVPPSYEEKYAFQIPFMSAGLSSLEADRVKKCINQIYAYHQYEIVSLAIDRILVENPNILESGYFTNETKESLDLLKDKFELVKIDSRAVKKISGMIKVPITFMSEGITFDDSRYQLDTQILLHPNPCDLKFHVTDVRIRAIRKGGTPST